MIKAYEIKGFPGLILFIIMSVIALSLITAIPTSFVWVTWNALVGDLFHGPLIAFWQAGLLTLGGVCLLYVLIEPQFEFQIKHVKNSEEAEAVLRKLKEQDSSK